MSRILTPLVNDVVLELSESTGSQHMMSMHVCVLNSPERDAK